MGHMVRVLHIHLEHTSGDSGVGDTNCRLVTVSVYKSKVKTRFSVMSAYSW